MAACGADRPEASPEAVDAGRYVHADPPGLTLVTVVNRATGAGEHSALVVNASQRVLFDPAGSWWHPETPQRADLIHGITERMLDHYLDYHARESHDVVLKSVAVDAHVAERALRLATRDRPATEATCALAVARLLQELPGFGTIRGSLLPNIVRADFARLDGVTVRIIESDAPADNRAMLARQHRTAAETGAEE